MEDFLTKFTYLGLTALMFGGAFGVPIPEDIPLIIAGALCAQGYADIYAMVPVALFSVIGADLTVWALGRRYGHHVPKLPLLRHYLTEPRLQRAEKEFLKHGGKTLFVARFIPGIRTAVLFTSGTFRMPWWKVLAFDGSAALLSVPTFVLLGFFLGRNWMAVKDWLSRVEGIIAIAAVLLLAGLIVWHYRRKRGSSTAGDAEQIGDGPDDAPTTAEPAPAATQNAESTELCTTMYNAPSDSLDGETKEKACDQRDRAYR